MQQADEGSRGAGTANHESQTTMADNLNEGDSGRRMGWLPETLTRAYVATLTVGFALVPSIAIVYLQLFQDPGLRFEHHAFHELAIGVAIVLSAFVSWVTWRCYESSGEAFLRWVTLGLVAFTVIYAPHGFLTRLADHNLPLFLTYGPASRLVMIALLVFGLLQYGKPAEDPSQFRRNGFWWHWITLFVVIDLVIAVLAVAPLGSLGGLRLGLESLALLCALAGIVMMLRIRHASPLLLIYAVALAMFAQSSASFGLSSAWNHQWWLAHTIFAGGFLLLSYGVVQAYHTTRSFSGMHSQEEMMRRLEAANAALKRLAATDALTGASNRRDFMQRIGVEWARAQREGTPLSLLALDLDHFKRINDAYGHAAGDLVLKAFVEAARAVLRPSDVIGRAGGEEFMILLPQDDARSALAVADRVRETIAGLRLHAADGQPLGITVSIGIATFRVDGDTPETVFRVADDRLYQAKRSGRDRVVGRPFESNNHA